MRLADWRDGRLRNIRLGGIILRRCGTIDGRLKGYYTREMADWRISDWGYNKIERWQTGN